MKSDCEHFGLQLSAYLDGELPEKERNEVEKHLETCRSCEQLVSELDEAGDVIKAALSPNSDQGVDLTGVWEEIETRAGFGPTIWQRIKSLVDRPVVWFPAAAATAAIALLIFVMPAEKTQEPVKLSRVESVYSQTGQVMLLQTAKSRRPIIWVLPKVQKEVGS